MAKKPTNKYKRIRVIYIINVVLILHVSATLLAIFMEVHCNGCITNVFEPMHKSNIYAVQQDTQSFLMIKFIHHVC